MRFATCVVVAAEHGRAISPLSTNDLTGQGHFISLKEWPFHLVKLVLEIIPFEDVSALTIHEFSLDLVAQKTKSTVSLGGIAFRSKVLSSGGTRIHSLTHWHIGEKTRLAKER